MKFTIKIVLLVGSAAMALASPIACPDAGPPMPAMPPKPEGVNEDLAVNVASVGNCPVRSTVFQI